MGASACVYLGYLGWLGAEVGGHVPSFQPYQDADYCQQTQMFSHQIITRLVTYLRNSTEWLESRTTPRASAGFVALSSTAMVRQKPVTCSLQNASTQGHLSMFRGFHRGCWRAPRLDPDHLEVSHVVLRMILIRGHSREHCLSFLSNTTINQPQPQPQNTQNTEHTPT